MNKNIYLETDLKLKFKLTTATNIQISQVLDHRIYFRLMELDTAVKIHPNLKSD